MDGARVCLANYVVFRHISSVSSKIIFWCFKSRSILGTEDFILDIVPSRECHLLAIFNFNKKER